MNSDLEEKVLNPPREAEPGGVKRRAEDDPAQEEQPARKKAKKEQKKNKEKKDKSVKDRVYEHVFGKDAQPSLEFTMKQGKMELKVRDLQNLVLWVLADGSNPNSWVFVKNKSLVERVVAVHWDSLGMDHWQMAVSQGWLPRLAPLFPSPLPTRGPGAKTKVYHALPIFLQVPLPKKKGTEKGAELTLPPLPHYTLSSHELEENLFPSPQDPKCASYVRLRALGEAMSEGSEERLHVAAIDCEMCRTEDGLELTRISVVDETERVRLDTFVRPAKPILDYLTRYSGVSPSDLEGVSTTLSEVQSRLQALLHEGTILLGHSLENDLHALKMVHGQVVDTSLLYPTGQEGRKNSLRWLAQRFLSQSIQEGSHDSVQDALTALRLVHLKLKNGPSFATHEEETESLLNRLERQQPPRRTTICDQPALARRFTAKTKASVVPGESDAEIAAAASSQSAPGQADFVLAHLHGLEDLLRNETEPSPPSTLEAVMRAGDTHLGRIWDSLPPRTLFILFSGHADIHAVKRLEDAKAKANKSGSLSVWLPEHEEKLLAAIEKARDSVSCIRLKPDPTPAQDTPQ